MNKAVMSGLCLFFGLFIGIFIVVLWPSATTLPQGTAVKETNPDVQREIARLQEEEVSTVKIGVEDATLTILKVYLSGEVYGLGGGALCKAYRLETKSKEREVGVMCRDDRGLSFEWKHHPWRDHFRYLS